MESLLSCADASGDTLHAAVATLKKDNPHTVEEKDGPISLISFCLHGLQGHRLTCMLFLLKATLECLSLRLWPALRLLGCAGSYITFGAWKFLVGCAPTDTPIVQHSCGVAEHELKTVSCSRLFSVVPCGSLQESFYPSGSACFGGRFFWFFWFLTCSLPPLYCSHWTSQECQWPRWFSTVWPFDRRPTQRDANASSRNCSLKGPFK